MTETTLPAQWEDSISEPAEKYIKALTSPHLNTVEVDKKVRLEMITGIRSALY